MPICAPWECKYKHTQSVPGGTKNMKHTPMKPVCRQEAINRAANVLAFDSDAVLDRAREAIKATVGRDVIEAIKDERQRQKAKWGDQSHRLTGAGKIPISHGYLKNSAEGFRNIFEGAQSTPWGPSWALIAAEEFAELLEAKTAEERYEEAIQCAAVFAAIAEDIKVTECLK